MVERLLIVNADDFGLSPGVNAGVARAHEEGILTSASMMVLKPAAPEAAAYARATPSVGVGLHVDLCEWTKRDGEWITVYEIVPTNDLDAVEREVRSQVDRFRELVGRDPTHLDSHQHVHGWSRMTEIFARVASEVGVPLRHHLGGVQYCGDLYGHDPKGNPIPEALTPDAVIEIIRALQPGVTELACHPGLGADTGSAYDIEREQEVELLCDPRIPEALRKEGIELRTFADIASAGSGAR
jgi:chitin disaccharide deacetylase